jgi:hypothetical protein
MMRLRGCWKARVEAERAASTTSSWRLLTRPGSRRRTGAGRRSRARLCLELRENLSVSQRIDKVFATMWLSDQSRQDR